MDTSLPDIPVTNTNQKPKPFWSNVNICSHGSSCTYCCWFWTGPLTESGHGRCTRTLYGKRYQRAHQIALALCRGSALPSDKQVNYHCDTPDCVNPQHLYLGTKRQNSIDFYKAERHRTLIYRLLALDALLQQKDPKSQTYRILFKRLVAMLDEFKGLAETRWDLMLQEPEEVDPRPIEEILDEYPRDFTRLKRCVEFFQNNNVEGVWAEHVCFD